MEDRSNKHNSYAGRCSRTILYQGWQKEKEERKEKKKERKKTKTKKTQKQKFRISIANHQVLRRNSGEWDRDYRCDLDPLDVLPKKKGKIFPGYRHR
jgi:hypothetical protein